MYFAEEEFDRLQATSTSKPGVYSVKSSFGTV